MALARALLLFALLILNMETSSGQCDPLAWQSLASSNGFDGDFFGLAIAIEGDLMIIGAPGTDGFGSNTGVVGAAYVFRDLGPGQGWTEVQRLQASDAAIGDRFGFSVALSGDVVAVTAAGVREGVYIFRWNGFQWIEEQKLTNSDGDGFFGYSVSLEGDTLVVGSPVDGEVAAYGGAAIVFRYSGGVWSEEAKLAPDNLEQSDLFGTSVSVSGDRIASGAPHGGLPGTNWGSTYVFRRDAGSQWQLEQQLVALDFNGWDRFGDSVSLHGDALLVGAPFDHDLGVNAGAAYFFRHDGQKWKQEQEVLPDGAPWQNLGRSVALEGETAVVGTFADGGGLVYVYRRINGEWIVERRLEKPQQDSRDHVGWSVAIDGDNAVSGNWRGPDEAGEVLVFEIPPVEPLWQNYGEGWPGRDGIPYIFPSELPILGSTLELNISSSHIFFVTLGALIVGFVPTEQDTPLGGKLLVLPRLVQMIPISDFGTTVSYALPDDPSLHGLQLYLQVLEQDDTASKGVSFTRGLKLVLWDCP